ncbi:MAG: hypothetical protein F2932_04345, partial [Actinobacteria bacterium]|nr:hypothetical protein [Actinomycetota bacterium]
MRLRLVAPVLAVLMFSTLVGTAQAESGVTIVAVGDVARSGGAQSKTATLTKNINPKKVLLIGDLAYQKGSDYEFRKYFLPKWKQFLGKTWAVPGNHEYKTENASGYRNVIAKYSMPSTNGDLWWVKRTGYWSVIGLDSEALTGASGTKQLDFLRQALLDNDGRPTIVTWHR